MKFFRPIFVWMSLLSFFAASCRDKDHRQVRVYTEDTAAVATPSKPSSMPAPPSASNAGSLQWAAPAGWEETPGSGFRLATFAIKGESGTGECILSQLGPGSGEPGSNIARWLGQLGVAPPATDVLNAFIEKSPRIATAMGTEATVFDLGEFSGEQGMLVAILDTPVSVYFVKLTGPKELLASERSRFEALTASLELR